MTALEIGCKRMDKEPVGSWSACETARHLEGYDGNGVTASLDLIMKQACDCDPGKRVSFLSGSVVPLESVASWALKLNVRLVSYLAGTHTFPESIGTVVPPTRGPAVGGLEGYEDLPPLIFSAALTLLSRCRDTVWLGDVYEEEDMAMSVDQELVKAHSADDGDLERRRSELPGVDAQHPAETSISTAVALLDIYIEYLSYLNSLRSRIKSPCSRPSPPASSKISRLSSLVSCVGVTLPGKPPRVHPNGIYVDHTTTTYADPPHFQETLLNYAARGQPTHACRYPGVSDAVSWWSASVGELETIEELWKVTASTPALLRRIRIHYLHPRSIVCRSVMSMALYSRDMIVGRVGLHEAITSDMRHLGIAGVICQDAAVSEFVTNCGRPVFEWVKVACWNRERRVEQVRSGKHCLEAWKVICSDALIIDRHLSAKLGVHCDYVFSYCLYYHLQYTYESLCLGGGGLGWFDDALWWSGRETMSGMVSILEKFKRSKDMMEGMFREAWVQERREQIVKVEEGKSKKKRKSKGKLQRELESVKYLPSPSSVMDSNWWSYNYHSCLASKFICSGMLSAYRSMKASGAVKRPSYEHTTEEIVFGGVVCGGGRGGGSNNDAGNNDGLRRERKAKYERYKAELASALVDRNESGGELARIAREQFARAAEECAEAIRCVDEAAAAAAGGNGERENALLLATYEAREYEVSRKIAVEENEIVVERIGKGKVKVEDKYRVGIDVFMV